MADINLLRNQLQDTTQASANRTRLFAWIMFLLLLVVVGLGVVLYLFNQQKQIEIQGLSATNVQLQQAVTQSQSQLSSAQTYQAQLSNIKTLLNNHIAISPVLMELEKYTYLRAQYLSFDVKQDTGKIHMEGSVDSYQGLAVLLIGLSTSTNFENVKLLSVSNTSTEEGVNNYTFSIDMTASEEIFKPLP